MCWPVIGASSVVNSECVLRHILMGSQIISLIIKVFSSNLLCYYKNCFVSKGSVDKFEFKISHQLPVEYVSSSIHQ